MELRLLLLEVLIGLLEKIIWLRFQSRQCYLPLHINRKENTNTLPKISELPPMNSQTITENSNNTKQHKTEINIHYHLSWPTLIFMVKTSSATVA